MITSNTVNTLLNGYNEMIEDHSNADSASVIRHKLNKRLSDEFELK